jgi:pre-mRNA-processing factor 40
MPDEVLLVLEQVEKEQKAALVPLSQFKSPYLMFSPFIRTARPVPPSNSTQASTALIESPTQNVALTPAPSTPINGLDGAIGHHAGSSRVGQSTTLPARPNLPDDPVIPHNGFATVEEGEKAFMHLLRKAGVDANWTWHQTMRAIITDPLYKALNTLAEKKEAWQKVITFLFETHSSFRLLLHLSIQRD